MLPEPRGYVDAVIDAADTRKYHRRFLNAVHQERGRSG